MIHSSIGNSGKITIGTVLSRSVPVSAGRQNLLSAIWGIGVKRNEGPTMPNGDPPSLMLWGIEEDGGVRRIAGRQKKS